MNFVEILPFNFMKRILITGGSGFIGRNLVEFLNFGYSIMAPNSKELDLLDPVAVRDFLLKKKVDVVVHCATHDASRNSKKDSALILDANLKMFFNLARCSDSFGRMFYFGSGAEYGRDHYRPYMSEDYFDVNVPVDAYGFSKYVMSKYVSGAQNIVDLRIFGCFGQYEDWEIRFISNAICKALYGIDITIKQNVNFDYLYIKDLARIIAWFIEQKDLKHKHYNVCTSESCDLLFLAEKVGKIAGGNVGVLVKESGFKPEYSGDNSRLLKELGVFKFTPVEEALLELYNWYAARLDHIDKELLLFDK